MRFLFFLIFILCIDLYSQTWEYVHDAPEGTFSAGDVKACDSNTFIASASITRFFDVPEPTSGVAILKTTDYGKNWEKVYSNESSLNVAYELNSIINFQTFSKDTIYGYNCLKKGLGCFYYSYDTGQSWDTLLLSNEKIIGIKPMKFKNSREGIILLNGNLYLKTNDYGKHWQTMSLPEIDGQSYSLEDIDIINNFVVIIISRPPNFDYFKKILVSEDFGETWKVIDDDLDTASYLATNLTLKSKNEWWLYGQKSLTNKGQTFLKKTTDKGNTWKIIEDEDFVGYGHDLQFFAEGIRFFTLGDTYFSTDNGKEWIKDGGLPKDNSAPQNVDFFSFNRGMMFEGIKAQFWSYNIISNVEENLDIYSFTIYPNPVQDELRIVNYEIGINYNIEIYNVLSEKVLTANISENNSINVSHLTPGVYFIKIGDQIQKFVKE